MAASKDSIHLIPKCDLKHYWSLELDELKSRSKDMYDLWFIAGKPRCGVTFTLMNDSKYKYKLAVRNTIKSYENKVSDELYDNLLEKNMPSFWKTRRSKLSAKPVHATHVSGLSNDSDIAEMFACKFATISDSKNRNRDQRCDASLCTDGYSVTSNNDEIGYRYLMLLTWIMLFSIS